MFTVDMLCLRVYITIGGKIVAPQSKLFCFVCNAFTTNHSAYRIIHRVELHGWGNHYIYAFYNKSCNCQVINVVFLIFLHIMYKFYN